MDIQINNFKNITDLTLQIDDNKVNFLFGISGSGKSSVCDAIMKKDIDSNLKIGKKIEELKVLVNGKEPTVEEFEVFSMDSIKDYVINDLPNKKGYEIIVQDDSKIREIQNNYRQSIEQLSENIGSVYELKRDLNELKSKIGGKLTTKKELPANAKIFAVGQELEKITNKTIYEALKSNGTSYVDWIKKGTELPSFKEKICPFCEKEMDDSIISRHLEMAGLTVSNLKHIFDTTEIFGKLRLNEPDWFNKEVTSSFAIKIREILKMEESLDKIISLVSFTNSVEVNPSDLLEVSVDDSIYKFLPSLEAIIQDINSRVKELREIVIQYKKTCDQTIGTNIGSINDDIRKLGIPYFIKNQVVSNNDQQANYILYHTDDTNKKNRSSSLSFGEKNIIALLLFIIVNKGKTIIIDDPVSSYDDFRRKQILDMIYKYSDNRTIIVLSHDHVFAKFASYEFDLAKRKQGNPKYSKKNKLFYELTGQLLLFENYDGNVESKPICFVDFQPIESHIINNMNTLDDYFRISINLRSLLELKKSNVQNRILWEYSSAILHNYEKSRILELLKDKGVSEDDILAEIRSLFPEVASKVSRIPDDYVIKIDTSDWSLYERSIAVRSKCKDENIKSELNNLVHMNDSLAVCLNPFKFNYFSKYVYDFVISSK